MHTGVRALPASRAMTLLLVLAGWGLEPISAQDCQAVEAMRAPDGLPLEAVAKWDGVKAFDGASRSADLLETIEFARPFRIYNELGEWMCVGEARDGSVVGWVSRKELLLDRKAQRHKKTGVRIKVMMRNNLEASSSGEWGKIWGHPTRRDAPPRREAGLYEVRHVFDVQKIDEGGRSEYAYLIGSGLKWNVDNSNVILDGWVSGDNVFLWNNRVGVQYQSGLDQAVRIYPRRGDLESVNCESQSPPWTFSSLEDGAEWPYDRERFPVISEALGSGCLERRRIMEVGGFGSVVLNRTELSATEGDHLLSTVNSLRGGSQRIDILFVIDGSASMMPAFHEVQRAMRQVKDQGALADARYALMVYKDRNSSWPPRLSRRLLDGVEFLRELDRHREWIGQDLGDRDFAESVLDGIQYGLDRMLALGLWRESSVRAMILIGDHGDRRDPDHQRRLTEVLETLQSQRVRFFAYQIRKLRPDSPAAEEAYRDFERDAAEIIRGMAGLFASDVAVAHGSAREIADALLEMCRWRMTVDGGYEAIRNGEVPPSKVGPYIEQMLRDSGLTLEQVMGYGRAPQVCEKGFAVLEDDHGRDLFEKRIRVTADDVAVLMVAFRQFLADVSSEKNCLRAMRVAFRAATGDRLREGETPRDFLRRTLGIDTKLDLLTQPFEELSAVLVNNRAKREELRRKLERSIALLDAVYREEQVTVRADGSVEPVYDGNEVKQQKWFKVLPDGTRIAWIPADYIP